MKIIHVTHTDLDGVGCEVLSRTAFSSDELIVYNENYGEVDRRIAEILDENSFDLLLITDISAREPKVVAALKEASKTKRIRLVDHHMTSSERYIGEDWATFSTDKCGTLSLYHVLTNEFGADICNQFDFAVAVNDYDLWIKANPLSDKLNSQLQFYGHDRFVDCRLEDHAFSVNHDILFPDEIKIVNEYEAYAERCVAELIENAFCMNFGPANAVVVFADKFTSQIGEAVRNSGKFTDCDFTVIIDLNNRRASLRVIKPGFNVGVFAQKYGGGGNPNTAGFQLSELARLSCATICSITRL